MKISFKVDVEPRPQPRPRFSRGKTFTPKDIVDYKQQIKEAALKTMGSNAPMNGAISCSMKFFKKFKATSRRFGDTDNLAKAVLDAMNGIVFADDSQVVQCYVSKTQSDKPKVEVEVATLDSD